MSFGPGKKTPIRVRGGFVVFGERVFENLSGLRSESNLGCLGLLGQVLKHEKHES
jgi:hypothetical protein